MEESDKWRAKRVDSIKPSGKVTTKEKEDSMVGLDRSCHHPSITKTST